MGPQICYEGLFDWFGRALANEGAQVIMNITNDSWYGTWEEPFQHGYMTLARAVEVRRPLVRSTNTGLSSVALASGEINGLVTAAPRVVSSLRGALCQPTRRHRVYDLRVLASAGVFIRQFNFNCLNERAQTLSMTNLDWDDILERLAALATSQAAREILSQLAPLGSSAEAEHSFAEIAEAVQILALGRRPFYGKPRFVFHLAPTFKQRRHPKNPGAEGFAAFLPREFWPYAKS